MGLNCLVGPSAWEACPTFQHWVAGFDTDVLPLDASPLLHLGAVPEALRYQAVLQATQAERWAIVGTDDDWGKWENPLLADRIQRLLDRQGRRQPLLKPRSLKVYGKGWSQSGDKQQRQGGSMTLWTTPGIPLPKN